MTKDDATWLNICYIVFAMIVAYIVYKASETVGLQLGLAERYDEWFPFASRLCSIVIGGGAALWLRSDEDRREYHVSAIGEIRKVTWPSVPDTKRMTIVVVVVVAIFSVILSLFDIAWSKILQEILP
ncbi:MAG: preprotein translocase subunit SecE [Oligoflexales bacterium]